MIVVFSGIVHSKLGRFTHPAVHNVGTELTQSKERICHIER